MKNKITYTLLLLTGLFLGCKKDLEVKKEKEYPIAHQYDAFYHNGELDSLIHVFGEDGEFSRIQSIQRNDSFYRVILWDGQNPHEMMDFKLVQNKVVSVWYYNHDGAISYLKHKYLYQNNRLDSCYTYIHRNSGKVVLQYKSSYQFNDQGQYLTITKSDIDNTPESVQHVEDLHYGVRFQYFTPYDLFPFSKAQDAKLEVVRQSPRYVGAGRPTESVDIRHKYSYNSQTHNLRILHYTTTLNTADKTSTTDTTQTIIRYHGI